MNLNHMPVARKLWVLVLAMVIPMVVLLVGVMNHLGDLDDQATLAVQASENRISMALRWKGLSALAVDQSVNALITTDEALTARLQQKVRQGIEAINVLQKQIESEALTADDKAQFERVAAARQATLDALAQASKLRADGDLASAQALVDSQFVPAVARYAGEQDAFVQLQERQRDAANAYSEAQRKRAEWASLGIAALMMIAGLALANLLVRAITQPLSRAVDLADAIATGDLTQDVHDDRRDELGDLLRSLSAMGARLRSVVGEVRAGVESVSAASSQIATGNQDLSARTEQTAANLEETAASMEELTATVTQSADTARQANQLAANAAQAAERGGEVAVQVVASMQRISDSSRKIADIIGVIDGIAFQTNILALNAAVEAARAGEQGRGFAVVAGEVRSLAQRSASAAREIKQLITTSVDNVEAGSAQVEQAGQAMQDIVQGVRRVSDLIGEITASSTEQRDGIGQVNQAVANLDQMTQQNAALVEEATAAAASMHEQAQRLSEVVSVFNVGSAALTAVRAPARASARAPAQALAPQARPAVAATARASLSKPAPAKSASPNPATPKPAPTKATPPRIAPASKPSVAAGADDDWESF